MLIFLSSNPPCNGCGLSSPRSHVAAPVVHGDQSTVYLINVEPLKDIDRKQSGKSHDAH